MGIHTGSVNQNVRSTSSIKTAISPTREENYAAWYQAVITAADLADNSPVRGCMVIKPWGYGIWEMIQKDLDHRIKATGHVNAYFPLLIPLSFLEKEAAHVEGFAKECAVVTHHRLIANTEGKLIPEGELEEPYVIRPTSETLIGAMYAKWIQSYRDLPVLINQWANVMRWEMRTRLFLRTSEFLWQEGHTAHATEQEAVEETKKMLEVYADTLSEILAIPVIKGEKPVWERFPGAVNTYSVEAMMQDRKGLQAGTSHFLGQNFAKAANIQFLNRQSELEHAWTTSWGVTTRLIGALIMVHSDDNGLVLPPRVAPQQVIILPIYRNDEERAVVLNYAKTIENLITSQNYSHQPIRVLTDDRDLRGGEKIWQWIKKGAPIRIEIGPRDVASSQFVLSTRTSDPKDKHIFKLEDLKNNPLSNQNINQNINPHLSLNLISQLLEQMHTALLKKSSDFLSAHTREIDNLHEFKQFFTPPHIASKKNPEKNPEKNAENQSEENTGIHGGFAISYALDTPEIENYLKPLKITARCIPESSVHDTGICLFTGKPNAKKMIFAKAY